MPVTSEFPENVMRDDIIERSDFGKRFCLACGGRLDAQLRHTSPPAERAARNFNTNGGRLPRVTGNVFAEYESIG